MVDITLLAGALGSLKNAYEISKAIVDLRDEIARQSAVLDLQRNIIEAQVQTLQAQASMSELVDKIRQLEALLEERHRWDETAAQYELKDFGGDTFAYTRKSNIIGGEPPHNLCPNCFQARKKSVLQRETNDTGRAGRFRCLQCGVQIFLGVRPNYTVA